MSDTGHAPPTFVAPKVPSATPPLSGNSIVLVKNLGATPIRCQYAGQWFIASSGDQVAMPWDAAVLWFGNPTLRDDPDGETSHRYRTKEAKRINLLYGMLNSPFYSNDPRARTADDSHGDPVPTHPYTPLDDLIALGWTPPAGIAATYTHRHPNLPVVAVTHTSGNQALIHMVIDDPFGVDDAVVQATIAAANDNAATANLAQKVAQQEAELAEMRALLRTVSPALTAALDGSSDTPHFVDPAAPGQDTTINPDDTAGDTPDTTPPETIDPLSPDVASVFNEERQASQRAKQTRGPKATTIPSPRPPSPAG